MNNLDNKYQRGKIYKLVCNKTGKVYYGSTCEKRLSIRKAKHKNNYKNYLAGKTNFTTSFNIIENNDYDIVLVELYPCQIKDELLARERFFIENNECVNKSIPGRSQKESKKNYRLTHKDFIHRKILCSHCNSCITSNNLSRHLKSKKCIKHLENLLQE